MKKFYLLFLSFICLCSSSVFADSPCDREMRTQPTQNCEKPCQKNNIPVNENSCFLCTNANMETLFCNMNLSETQICNAEKIQDKYEQEVLSISERIDCENAKYRQLKQACAKWNELHKQKSLIRKLEKKRKQICECYEKEFKTTLSRDQIRTYNKYAKRN